MWHTPRWRPAGNAGSSAGEISPASDTDELSDRDMRLTPRWRPAGNAGSSAGEISPASDTDELSDGDMWLAPARRFAGKAGDSTGSGAFTTALGGCVTDEGDPEQPPKEIIIMSNSILNPDQGG
jgi:hypothetical protein